MKWDYSKHLYINNDQYLFGRKESSFRLYFFKIHFVKERDFPLSFFIQLNEYDSKMRRKNVSKR